MRSRAPFPTLLQLFPLAISFCTPSSEKCLGVGVGVGEVDEDPDLLACAEAVVDGTGTAKIPAVREKMNARKRKRQWCILK